jgi:alpha-amylase
MNKIYLIFGCHCHQPLGNFEMVIDRIYYDAYLAFLEVISRHPKIKITLHYSGILLDWISEKHPEFFKILAGLVKRGQVELLSGSYYEAILPVIPERDQVEQIRRLSGFIEKKFTTLPQGMWLAERVWEPKLAKTLTASGMKFSLVDDFHFKAAGLKEAELLGYFNVEDEGSLFSLFPISEWLRYSVPFKEVEQSIEYLRQMSELKENALLVIVDDGEKFGAWPGTKKWVYEEGWLEHFLSALEENSQWIETLTCSDCIQRFPPAGLVYLPIGAYFEMGEWSLFAERAIDYQSLFEKLKQEGLLEKYKGFLKGGIWRNFLVKYPESNQLHKKMVALSQSIHKLEKSAEKNSRHKKTIDKAYTELLKSQCNDGYWHGVFGGLYLPHLRDALYRHLIQGERHVEQIIHHQEKEWCDAEVFDFDGDGQPEIILSNPWLKAYFDPAEGGMMFELDYKPNNFNLTNSIARRLEHYHQAIVTSLEKKKGEQAKGHASIHDLDKGTGLERLKEYLVYDKHRRACLIDHLLDKNTDLSQFSSASYSEKGNFVCLPYEHSIKKEKEGARLDLKRRGALSQNGLIPVEIVKRVRMLYNDASLDISYVIVNCGNERIEFSFGAEFNFATLAGRSPQVTIAFGKEEERYLMATSGIKAGVNSLEIRNELEKFSLSLDMEKEPAVWWFPVETISQSEKGFDLTYQSTVVMPKWEIILEDAGKWTAGMRISVKSLRA